MYLMCEYEGMDVMLDLRNLAQAFKVHWLYLIGSRELDVSSQEKCFNTVFKKLNLMKAM